MYESVGNVIVVLSQVKVVDVADAVVEEHVESKSHADY